VNPSSAQTAAPRVPFPSGIASWIILFGRFNTMSDRRTIPCVSVLKSRWSGAACPPAIPAVTVIQDIAAMAALRVVMYTSSSLLPFCRHLHSVVIFAVYDLYAMASVFPAGQICSWRSCLPDAFHDL
jgi:hypothetical protein